MSLALNTVKLVVLISSIQIFFESYLLYEEAQEGTKDKYALKVLPQQEFSALIEINILSHYEVRGSTKFGLWKY